MKEKLNIIAKNAKVVHESLRGYYSAWQDLEEMAKEEGYKLDEKTAELKKL